MLIKKHLDLMGYEVQDRVSDFCGVVISISFDLYGCVQADVRSKKLDKDGRLTVGHWFDVGRLKVLTKKPLMEQPNFEWGGVAEGRKGAASLPMKI